MKIQEIRELSDKEREEKIHDLNQEFFNLKFQLATGKIENPARLRLIRRDVARLKTVQHQQAKGEASTQKA
ncbi:MAG: 50S ribosomal protein L29 [Nitrospinae bacterium CG11_big_fil_rev_8_21_14_0_20_56_8]|nr:MAG: 50S ribosomal protein L29 [Nitrospinae bacterium CG11_big_fil_rev_8_21_14_0_20_56_8]